MKLNPDTPKVLYKYRDWGCEHHRKILYNLEIFLPSASKFNDPYEGNIPFEYDPAELTGDNMFLKLYELAKIEHPDWKDDKLHPYIFEAQQKNLIHDPNHIEKVREFVKCQIEGEFGIFSLTRNPNNFLMWSHYANSHKGFCVGFNSLECAIGPVTYSNKIPKFALFEPINVFTVKLLGTKGTFWEHEEEYRIIKQFAANQAFKIPAEGIEEVILGCNMDQNTKRVIIDYIKQNLTHCRVFESKPSFEHFKIIQSQVA